MSRTTADGLAARGLQWLARSRVQIPLSVWASSGYSSKHMQLLVPQVRVCVRPVTGGPLALWKLGQAQPELDKQEQKGR